MPLQILWLALAGAAGTLCRFVLATIVYRLAGDRFAWGTLLVNVMGCFLFGVVLALAEQRAAIGPNLRFILLTGFMGAFTTFSTFAFETYNYAQDGRWAIAVLNMVSQNVLGVLCLIAGIGAVRILD